MMSNPKPPGRRHAGHRATEAPSSGAGLERSPSATEGGGTAGPAWDERQFGSLVANVPGAVYRCVGGAWDLVFMSAEVENICGYPAADFLGDTPARTRASVIHPEDRDLVASTVDEAIARRLPFMIDYRIVHANGELRRAWERGRGVFDADGRLQFVDGVIFDHTEQERADQQHRLLFEHNPQPILAYERATLWIIAVSDAAVASYGYSREEFLSMTVQDLTPPEDVDKLMRYLETEMGTEQPGLVMAYPMRHRYKDGTIVDVEVTSNDLTLDGLECRIGLCQNVTERNKASAELAIARDEAVEASNMKSAFLANMSHEIRTPMNGVIGMNELLLDTELSDEQRSYAEQVARSGEHMMTIINDVLDLSRIEAGQLELDVTDFDLHESIGQACAAAGLQAGAKGIRLGVHIDADVPPRVRGDSRRLRQVLMNLVANAVKFTTEGEVAVHVGAQPRLEGDAVVRVEVTDTGIGIEPSILERMFEPFTQADASTTRNYGGTGLGLAIARELIDLMGGTIGAETQGPGRGSTFWFELELAAPVETDGRSPRLADASAAAPPMWLTAPLVLVAEDSPVNQIVAVRMLERCGCRVEVVGDGRQALAALSTQRYDAVLMDCQMPEMDGYEATVELRRRENGGHRTPVIAMTAHAMAGDRETCARRRHGRLPQQADPARAVDRHVAAMDPATDRHRSRRRRPEQSCRCCGRSRARGRCCRQRVGGFDER